MANHQKKSILLALNWIDYRLVQGVARYAKEHDWHLSTEMLLSRHIVEGWSGDGAVTGYGPEVADMVLELGVPKVDITLCDIPAQIPRVAVDNTSVGRLAAEHLHDCGFRNFAYYGADHVWASRQRRDAFRHALHELGVPPERIADMTIPRGGLTHRWPDYRAHVARQLDALPRPVAVYSGLEIGAANLLDIAVSAGLRVPEEIAVLGTDNIHYLCECQAVPLSSIETRQHEVGYRAAAQLDRLMRGEIGMDAEPVLVPPAGVAQRQSTDVVAVSHPAVSRALRYLRDHFREPISALRLQKVSGMSDRGLQKAFTKAIGRPPGAELRRLRLQHARRMLVETDEKVATIAHECGYSNSTNLGIALRRETGLSPRAYRQQFGGR